MTERRAGLVVFRVEGAGAEACFADEAGGHRWQRIPPTERRGRVQTSTVTVAVLPEPEASVLRIDERDLEWSFCSAGGPGGQHVNKTQSVAQVLHKPSGVRVRCETERSQAQNKRTALSLLRARLAAHEREQREQARGRERREQVGSGMRGDKRRTVRCQDGVVNDHKTRRHWSLRDYLRGAW